MTEQGHVVRQLLTVLEQGRRFLQALDPELYRLSPAPLAQSPIGAHVRHVLDCCVSLLDGLDGGRIDYDRRERDARLETEPQAALALLGELLRRVAGLADADPHGTLQVKADVPAGAAPTEFWRASTVGREVVHVLSHTVHHYALIAILVRHFGVTPEEDFGVAPSTLRYWEESGRCAPLAG